MSVRVCVCVIFAPGPVPRAPQPAFTSLKQCPSPPRKKNMKQEKPKTPV